MSAPTLRELKSRGQLLKPVVRLGKSGVTPEFLVEFEKVLDQHGLVKLRFEGFKEERKSLSKDLAERTGAQLVQQVGHTAVYFRAKAASVSR